MAKFTSGYSFSILNKDGTASSTRADFADMFVRKELFFNAGTYACGYNLYGQLGNNVSGTNQSSPVQVGSLTNWNNISVGVYHNLMIKTDSTLWSCGYNSRGQLGNNTRTNYSSPIQVGTQGGWRQVSAGWFSSAAVKSDGTLYTWGLNNFGQLGLGNVVYYSSPVQVGSLTNWQQVACGYRHMYAIKTDGTLWAWGWNVNGVLGVGNTAYYSSPVQVGSLTNWKSLATYSGGAKYLLALKTDNTMWTCGWNTNGELGINTQRSYYSSPVQVGSLTEWASVSAGSLSAFAIKLDGTLWAWGNGNAGQIPIGVNASYSSPVQIGTQTNWKQVSGGSGNNHNLAVKTDGTLWGWGWNNFGQLGNNARGYYSSPIQIGSLTGWKQVSAGYDSTMMILSSTTPFSAPLNGTINYTLGVGGAGGTNASAGTNGTASTLTYNGITLTANGGAGGTTGAAGTTAGGTATGGTATASGGTGSSAQNNGGGGGGGGINLSNAVNAGPTNGGSGANALDFNGLAAVLARTGYALGAGGAGATGVFPTNQDNGYGAYSTSIGAGGGGSSSVGGAGGDGGPGGGGGGATSTSVNLNGGNGGPGILILRLNNVRTVVLTSGTSYQIPPNTFSLQAWLIGAGGGGGASSPAANSDGNGGGAGGICYQTWL